MKKNSPTYLDSVRLIAFNPDDYSILDANEATLNFYGYSREEFLALTLNDLVPGKNPRDTIGECKTNAFWGRIFTHVKANGQICYVALKPHSSNRDPETTGLLTIVYDMTKQFEQKRFPKNIPEFFQTIPASNDPLFIMQWDRELKLCKLAEETKNFFGWTYKGVIGKNIFEESFVYPNQKAEFKSFINNFLRRKTKGCELDVEHLAPAGHTVLYRWRFSRILNKQGKTVWVTGVGRRILKSTENKGDYVDLEDKFHILAEESQIGVYLVQDGIVRYINPKMTEMFGYERNEMVDKMSPLDPVYPEDRPMVTRNMQLRLSGEEDSIHYWFRAVHKKGHVLYMDTYGTRITYRGKPAIIGSMLDVTEQVKTAKKLKESEERYHTIFEQAAVGIGHVSLTGQWLEVNQQLCQILGYSREELLTMRFRDITHPDDKKNDLRMMEDLIKGDKGPFIFEKRYLRKDNTFIWVQLTTALVRNEQGEPRYIVTVYQDITDRKRYMEILRANEDSYRQLFNAIGDSICIIDSDFCYVDANDRIMGMYGYLREEIIGETPEKLSAENADMKLKRSYFTQALKGKSKLFEWWGRRKNGEIFPEEVLYSPGTYRGEKVVIATVRDITERYEVEQKLRENEELFRQLFQNSPFGIVMMNDDHEIKMANHAFEKIFGYKNDELNGLDIDKLIVPDQFKDRAPELTMQAYSGKSFQDESIRKRKDGSLVPVLIVGVPVLLNNKTIAVFGLYVDITDRKKAEEELRNSEQRWQLLVDNHPDAVIITSQEIIQFMNKAGAKLFGAQQPSKLIGTLLHDLLLPENVDYVTNELKKLKKGSATIPFEQKIIGMDKKERYIESQSVPVVYRGERSIQTVARDITERKIAQDHINRSLKEKEVLLAEIHHRVKNNLAVIAGLLQLKAFNTESKEVQEALVDSQRRVQSIALIHEKLYQSDDLSEISYDTYLRELISLVINSMGSVNRDIDIEINAEPVSLNINQAIPCGLILNELVTNAYKHAFTPDKPGLIKIDLAMDDGKVKFRIHDNGTGLPAEIDPLDGNSLGMTLVTTLSRQLNATFEMKNDDGALFELTFEKE